jgi:hypothetical protein
MIFLWCLATIQGWFSPNVLVFDECHWIAGRAILGRSTVFSFLVLVVSLGKELRLSIFTIACRTLLD